MFKVSELELRRTALAMAVQDHTYREALHKQARQMISKQWLAPILRWRTLNVCNKKKQSNRSDLLIHHQSIPVQLHTNRIYKRLFPYNLQRSDRTASCAIISIKLEMSSSFMRWKRITISPIGAENRACVRIILLETMHHHKCAYRLVRR